MTGGSSRGPRGGIPTSHLEAEPRTVEMFIFQRQMLGNGLLLLVQLTVTTFVKEVSK